MFSPLYISFDGEVLLPGVGYLKLLHRSQRSDYLRRRAIVTEIWVFEIKSVVCFAASLVDRSLDFDVVTLSLVRLHQNSASDELASFSEKWSSE